MTGCGKPFGPHAYACGVITKPAPSDDGDWRGEFRPLCEDCMRQVVIYRFPVMWTPDYEPESVVRAERDALRVEVARLRALRA